MLKNTVYSALLIALLFSIYSVFHVAGNPLNRAPNKTIHTAPLGLPALVVPEDNPMTLAKIELGRKLFFDRRLSLNHGISCAMCHVPEQGFTNNQLAVPVGFQGRSGRRNAPTMYNLAYMEHYFQDGREPSLETQAFDPLLAGHEMNNPSVGSLLEKIRDLPDYRGKFEHAFAGRLLSADTLGMAFAAYLRSLTSANSAFDRWMYGNESNALNTLARRGYALFTGKAGCSACHQIEEDHALFTDNLFHNTGIGYRNIQTIKSDSRKILAAPGVYIDVKQTTIEALRAQKRPQDLGRYEATQNPADRWRYRTPSLRNIALTAPYMHDGSIKSLKDVIDYYNKGGHRHALQSPLVKPLKLTESEQMALVEFLNSLTGDNVTALAEEARKVEVGELTGKDPHWRHQQ